MDWPVRHARSWIYTLSDDQTEYQLRDRLSFMRIAGLALHDAVPDARTIWLFRVYLVGSGALDRLFGGFDAIGVIALVAVVAQLGYDDRLPEASY